MSKYKKIIILPFIFYAFLVVSMFSFCESDSANNEVEIQELINLINKRLNLKDISFECQYQYIDLDLLNNENQILPYCTYKYQKGNFLKEIWHFPEENSTNIDKPQNLFELIVKRLNKQRKTDNIEVTQIYHYNDIISPRTIRYEQGGGNIEIIQHASDGIDNKAGDADPLCLIGYFGMDLFKIIRKGKPLHIIDYLNTPGQTIYYEKDGYKVLWHYVEDNPNKRGLSYQPGIEIWVDSEGNIVKIVEGHFYTRIFGEEKIKQILDSCLDSKISRDFPVLVYRIYKWSNFYKIDDERRIPLKCKVTYPDLSRVGGEKFPICLEKFDKYYEQGKYLETRIIQDAVQSLVPAEEETIEIKENSIVTNITIPDEDFIAPTPDIPRFHSVAEQEAFYNSKFNKTSDLSLKESFYIPGKAIIFVVVCVVITIIAMFITRKYFGWGL